METVEPRVQPGERFVRAVGLACELHRTQARKGSDVPYLAHLLAVAALVLEDGGSEDEAIAALLHDAAEDQGGRPTLERIKTDFGPKIAAIVEGCSDTLEGTAPGEKKPDWRPRKEAYVAHLATASPSVRRVAAADKLHNLTSLLDDVRTNGLMAFERFNSHDPRDQVWYYQACANALTAGGSHTRLATRVLEGAQQLDDAVSGLAGHSATAFDA